MKYKDKYLNLSSKIFQKSHKIWYPKEVIKNKQISHSWFNIDEKINPKKTRRIICNFVNSDDKIIKCKIIRFFPTKLQKKIILNWLKYTRFMYNETIRYFKKQKKIKTFNWKKIRNILKIKKKLLINKSKLKNIPYNTAVNSHVMDASIKRACTCYKSCLTNYRNGNIKHFRIRYLKKSKPTNIFHIEKYFVSRNINTFCRSVFKNEFRCESNYQLKNIKNDFTLYHNYKKNLYLFLVPYECDTYKAHNNKDVVSLDPGIRTFMTGYSTTKCMDIGSNMYDKIKTYIKKIDNAKRYANKLQFKKVQSRCHSKIDNLINDLHWKSIKYLTNNYGSIHIGNMSTKKIISNRLTLNKKVKRVASFMKLFVFKQRLQFKCKERQIMYKEIDEAYTSKTCSNCCLLNLKLGSSKIFNCNICGVSIDRDINGARNIMLKSL